ncbi:MAG: GNAT family N-acetyltransferase, partial [Gallionellaceae bacterium]|nr:GNAT family N-acetyltransferase [Gallionellaceae bacterium]
MIRYELASPADDAALRALLRANQLPSWAVMTMEREQSYFAGMDHYGHDWAVIARDAGDEVVGMYAAAIHAVHCNGAAADLGYLGALRVNPAYRHRIRILKQGYASIPHLSPAVVPFWYSVIASGNAPSQRILAANLPGMPHYRKLNELVTLTLPTSRGRRLGLWRAMRPDETGAVCELYNREAARYHFAPALTPERIAKTGAPFYVAERDGVLLATMALWNQQPWKQVVSRGYMQPLATVRPLWNLFARLSRRVCLPRTGSALDQTFLAFLAVSAAMQDEIHSLLLDALALCSTRVLLLGLHDAHSLLDQRLTQRFRPLYYRGSVYTVSFGASPPVDARPAQPEIA